MGEVWESNRKVFSTTKLSESLAAAVEEVTTEFLSTTSGKWKGGHLRVIDNLEKTTTEFLVSPTYSDVGGGESEADVRIEETDTDPNYYYRDAPVAALKAERIKAIESGIGLMSDSESVNCITFTDFSDPSQWVQVVPTSIDDDGDVVLGSLNLAYPFAAEPDIDYPEFAADVDVVDWKAGSYVTLSIGTYLRRNLAMWIDNYLSVQLGSGASYNLGFEPLTI